MAILFLHLGRTQINTHKLMLAELTKHNQQIIILHGRLFQIKYTDYVSCGVVVGGGGGGGGGDDDGRCTQDVWNTMEKSGASGKTITEVEEATLTAAGNP